MDEKLELLNGLLPHGITYIHSMRQELASGIPID